MAGNWFDNRGVTFPLNGTIKDTEMTIIWGDDQTEFGKTIYSYNNDSDQVTTEDFIMSNGIYLKFGRAIYNHKD